VIGTFLGVLIQSWWTKIATGILLFAFIALQQRLVALARRPSTKRAGAAS